MECNYKLVSNLKRFSMVKNHHDDRDAFAGAALKKAV
jgi:hypothetical protein